MEFGGDFGVDGMGTFLGGVSGKGAGGVVAVIRGGLDGLYRPVRASEMPRHG